MHKPSRGKILFVIGQLERGGTELHLLQLCSRGELAEFELVVLSLQAGGRLTPDFEAAGVRVREPSGCSRGLVGAIASMRWIAGVVAEERADIVHFYLPKAYLLGGLCLLARRAGGKVMSRRSLNLYQRRHFGVAVLERVLHRSMDACLANSTAVARELAREGVPRDKLGIIRNAVAPSAPRAAADNLSLRSRFDLGADDLVIVTVANLIAYKGHQDVLDALSRIAGALPRPWAWCCLGRDDGIGPTLRVRAQAAGLADNVRWLGELDNVGEFLGCADLAVQASHQEGFSNAILECMAAGLAVIATDVGGNDEAVADGENGLLVPAADPASLARAILALASDPGRRARLGTRGREDTLRSFSIEQCASAYTEIYRNLIDGLPRPIPRRLQTDFTHD